MSPLDGLHLRSDRRLVATALLLLLAPTLWYSRTDLSLYTPDDPLFWGRVVVRLVLLSIVVVGLFAMRSDLSRDRYAQTTGLVAWGITICVLGLNALRPPGTGMPLRAPLFILALLYAVMPNDIRRQVLPPLALTAGLVALRLTRLTEGVEADIPGDIVILLAFNAVGILVVRQRISLEADLASAWEAENASRTRTEAALSELRTLRGIIPICSYCRRVRSDDGDWQHVERYVKENSEAEFSHGICPSCFEVQEMDTP